ncbi:hypothetical protein [Aliiroseovarius sp. PrR006]|uniref:hypothetical protein n=1 Tax=Aliiroseovarius sp. PrR006 TaxID=2706883 RepID=UPI0013D7E1FB|nr:hypothetical protein [Aliiroseovarius sp. PrR006]NDW53915.1 hypothetical protein [Aliiroseovarius sp. PrR006]
MTTKTDTARTSMSSKTSFWLRALNWVADRDAAYRSAQKLRSMPDERLEDMGITREQTEMKLDQRKPRKARSNTSHKLVAHKFG